MIIHTCESIFNHFLSFSRTEQNSDRRIITLIHLIFLKIRHISIQLAQIGVTELIVFKLYYDIAIQNTIVENEVGKIIFIIYNHPFLSCLKTKTFSHFKQKILQMRYQCVF